MRNDKRPGSTPRQGCAPSAEVRHTMANPLRIMADLRNCTPPPVAFIRRRKNSNEGGKIVRATWRQVLGQRAFRWSLFGDYGTSVKHTVTTLIADDAIPERATKQGLPLL